MEIRNRQVKMLFTSRYPWADEISVVDNTDWSYNTECGKGPHFKVEVNDDGVWRYFNVKISVEEEVR